MTDNDIRQILSLYF